MPQPVSTCAPFSVSSSPGNSRKMDVNLLTEINYLTRLIEQHKKKLPPDVHQTKKILFNQNLSTTMLQKCTNLTYRSQVHSKPLGGETYGNTCVNLQPSVNVHVNPNFKHQNPVIHINPKVQVKPLIHVNPKIMKDITMTDKNFNVTVNVKKDAEQPDTKRSVYVHPNLMKKLSSVAEPKPVQCKQVSAPEATRPVCSRLKLVKSTNAVKTTPRRLSNSSVVILSRSKLVRVRRVSKGSIHTSPVGSTKLKKSVASPFKKTRTSLKIVRIPKASDALQRTSKDCNMVKSTIIRPKINRYRIDRTVTQATKVKQQSGSTPKKVLNNTMELITIGGIVYKSSRNQLVRRSYSIKKKRLTSVKNDKFVITTNGKKLRRVKPTKDTAANYATETSRATTALKLVSNVSPKINHKTNISNKVKQRSIQILRNKMRKNNQPCLIYQRFGYCANNEKGTCPKLHDKKQVSLCKKFLQGNCHLDSCPLSHDVGPEKMPTCKYFLEGCCTRDACPYRHVKVSSNTPICIEFLKGYCAMGQECKKRHENVCPDFDKTGKCSKGKYCPYPHKSQSQPSKSTVRQNDKYSKRKEKVINSNDKRAAPAVAEVSSSNCESRLRYYEQTDTLIEDMEKKREDIMRKIKIMKAVNVAAERQRFAPAETSNGHDAGVPETSSEDNELEIISETRKRPPIGSLPAYIPIN